MFASSTKSRVLLKDSSLGWRFLNIAAYFSIWLSVFASKNAMSIFGVLSLIASTFARSSEVSAKPAKKMKQVQL